MTAGPITLTVGWIGRHTPPGAGVDGRDAAVIDIAQDLLLRDLHERGSLDSLVFKGGTSLRKLYAGIQRRFSLDLDFSVADPSSDADTASELAKSTKATYSTIVVQFIDPGVGQLRLRELGVPAVDRLLRVVREKHGATRNAPSPTSSACHATTRS